MKANLLDRFIKEQIQKIKHKDIKPDILLLSPKHKTKLQQDTKTSKNFAFDSYSHLMYLGLIVIESYGQKDCTICVSYTELN